MKKNKMMRVASILLVAVLLTTSVISGTFAKYVTSAEKADSARVAKFGVVVTADGNLFSTNYKRVADGNTPGTAETDHSLTTPNTNGFSMTVESSDTTNVVAPGTKNTTGLAFDVKGQPEVDVNVKLDFTATKDVFLKANTTLPDMTKAAYTGTFDNTADYHPIVFTLKGDYLKTATLTSVTGLNTTKQATDGEVSGTLAQIKAVFDVINNNGTGIYVDANTDLATAIGSFTLTWEWDFDANGAGTYDKQDTLLGDIAAGTVIDYVDGQQTGKIELPQNYTLANGDYSTDVSVALTISVTQVD